MSSLCSYKYDDIKYICSDMWKPFKIWQFLLVQAIMNISMIELMSVSNAKQAIVLQVPLLGTVIPLLSILFSTWCTMIDYDVQTTLHVALSTANHEAKKVKV